MLTRRAVCLSLSAAALVPPAGAVRTHPRTGAAIPAVGLGTWITFNVGSDPVLLDNCAAVMAAFFEAGGGMIDSSPMYGSAQETVGYGLEKLGVPSSLVAADKIWTPGGGDGAAQAAVSRAKWGVKAFDLLQVHNLVDWTDHLPVLQAMKADGRLGAVGITTSHGRRHGDLEAIMATEDLDFVQLTLNPVDREAEERLLPLAADRGIGVIVNRPMRRGWLPERLEGHPLPGWAADLGIATWAQASLKFILSHPAVTVAIPATTSPAHVRENKAAAEGPMPDAALRERIARDIRALV